MADENSVCFLHSWTKPGLPLHDSLSLSLSHPTCRWVEDDSLVEEEGSFTNWLPGSDHAYPQPTLEYDQNCMWLGDLDGTHGTWADDNCDNNYSLALICSKPIATAAHNITRP